MIALLLNMSRYALHDMERHQFESMSMYLYFAGGNHFEPILDVNKIASTD